MKDNVVMLYERPRVKILPVLENDFDKFLGIGMEMIAPAVARQLHNVSMLDVERDILSGGAVMWLVHAEDTPVAAITTCVVKHPQRTNLKIEFMGGTGMRTWMNEAVSFLANIAKVAGLDALEADGRKGFERYVDGSKFTAIYTHYEMELN